MSKKIVKKAKVVVAMSGGVDSSLTASLLKERGYDVSGVFLNLGQSSYKQALNAVKKVAKKIGIPLKVINLKKQFKKEVVNYFLETYRRGDTPNPCIVCNNKIKFGLFFDKALKMGAPACRQAGICVATGHYVRLRGDFPNSRLFIAKDKNKDQSYFLYNLTQKQLKKLLFPMGDYAKKEVRKMADQRQLPYLKKESQDICFLSSGISQFLKKNLKLKKGEVITFEGKIIGHHNGLPLYTIGQKAPIGGIGPYYVAVKNLKKNQLVAAKKDDERLLIKEIRLKNVNWISGQSPKVKKVLVRMRYRQPLVAAEITFHISYFMLRFNQPVKFVAPGQSAVFYGKNGPADAPTGAKALAGKELLGGGVIM